MEVKLTITGLSRWNRDYRGVGIFLCAPSLRRKIDLPKDATKIYAVFSKTLDENLAADSFTIQPPYGYRSRIREYRSNLTWRTEEILARKYRQGFRYVHIEY